MTKQPLFEHVDGNIFKVKSDPVLLNEFWSPDSIWEWLVMAKALIGAGALAGSLLIAAYIVTKNKIVKFLDSLKQERLKQYLEKRAEELAQDPELMDVVKNDRGNFGNDLLRFIEHHLTKPEDDQIKHSSFRLLQIVKEKVPAVKQSYEKEKSGTERI